MKKSKHKLPRTWNKDFLLWLLVLGGAVLIASSNPKFPIKLIRGYLQYRSRLKERLLKLEKAGWIKVSPKGDDFEVQLVRDGQLLALRYQIEKLRIKRPEIWDGIWRVVTFDIPEEKKQARDILRDKLNNLGFYQLQKSVFIHSFPCREEIEVIKTAYEIWPYISYIEARKIIPEKPISDRFSELINQ